jgi:hypothetical protein
MDVAAAAEEEEENIRGWGIVVVERRKEPCKCISWQKFFPPKPRLRSQIIPLALCILRKKEVRSIPKDQSKKGGRLAAQMVGEADLGIGRGWGVGGFAMNRADGVQEHT